MACEQSQLWQVVLSDCRLFGILYYEKRKNATSQILGIVKNRRFWPLFGGPSIFEKPVILTPFSGPLQNPKIRRFWSFLGVLRVLTPFLKTLKTPFFRQKPSKPHFFATFGVFAISGETLISGSKPHFRSNPSFLVNPSFFVKNPQNPSFWHFPMFSPFSVKTLISG